MGQTPETGKEQTAELLARKRLEYAVKSVLENADLPAEVQSWIGQFQINVQQEGNGFTFASLTPEQPQDPAHV